MAFLTNPSAGTISGKVGRYIFRRTKNGIVIASVPDNVKQSDSPVLKRNQGHMKYLSPLCRELNKIQIISSMWKKVEGNNISSKFNKVNKYLVGEGADISNIFIAPWENYFNAVLQDIQEAEGKISVTFEPITTHTLITDYKYVSAQGVIQLWNEEMEYPEYIGIASKDEELNNTESITFNLYMSSSDVIKLSEYSSHKFLLNLVIKNNNLEPTAVSHNIFITPE